MAKNYNFLVRDDNRVPIMTGSGILTADATSSPQNSPLAITTGVTTIVVPPNAVEMVVIPSVAMRISEDAGMSTYFVLPASASWGIPLGNTDQIYLRSDSGSGTLQFCFITV